MEYISHLPKLLAGVSDRGVGRICNGDFYITQLTFLEAGKAFSHESAISSQQLFCPIFWGALVFHCLSTGRRVRRQVESGYHVARKDSDLL